MRDLDEPELLARCKAGQDGAFEELVDRYKDLVYAMVHRLARGRQDADDLAQEVFLKIHRGLPYFRGEARLSTWIYRIVANVCFEAAGRRAREVPVVGAAGASRDPGAADEAFADLELKDRLEKAIARLPEHYQVLVAGHYLKGVRYDALAEAVNLPIGTVKTHLYRAKRRLRELLDA